MELKVLVPDGQQGMNCSFIDAWTLLADTCIGQHRRHSYYRSFMRSSREMNPEFDDEGYNSIYSTDSAEESERERTRKHHLGKLARRRFEAMLRALSGRRRDLARCMAFSLEHAEAASEVSLSCFPLPRRY